MVADAWRCPSADGGGDGIHRRVLGAHCGAYYRRLVDRGKPKKVALIALARKLVRICFAVLRTAQPFDVAYKRPLKAARQPKCNTVFTIWKLLLNVRGYWLPTEQELTKEQIKTFRGHRSFVVVRKRWIVERSIAWTTFQRRLNRDYEFLSDTTEAWVTLTFVRLMIRRLAQPLDQPEHSQTAA